MKCSDLENCCARELAWEIFSHSTSDRSSQLPVVSALKRVWKKNSACVGFPRVDYHCSVPQGLSFVFMGLTGGACPQPAAPTLSPGVKPELLHC